MSGKPDEGLDAKRRTGAFATARAPASTPKPDLAAAIARSKTLGPKFKTKEELFDALDKAREG